MAVIAFVAVWVVVALGLLFIALRGGRKQRAGGSAQSHATRTASYAAFAAVFVLFGVGVPIAASLGNEANSDQVPAAGISSLTAQEEKGRELFGQYCKLCHTLEAANAIATVGPDLDRLRPTKALVLDAIENGRSRGNGAMAADLVVGEDAEAVAAFVAKAVGQADG